MSVTDEAEGGGSLFRIDIFKFSLSLYLYKNYIFYNFCFMSLNSYKSDSKGGSLIGAARAVLLATSMTVAGNIGCG